MAWTIRQMDDFAVGRDGDGSALVVFLASIRCSVWGHSDPHAGRIDVHIAPDVGATSFGSPPVANRAHRRSNLGRSARGRSRGAITRLDVGKGYFGEHVRSLPNISGLTGRLRGRARRLLGRGPTAPRLAALVHQRKPCHSGHCRAIHVPSSLLKAKGIERGWL